jgi:uncharacterized membrane protein YkoI
MRKSMHILAAVAALGLASGAVAATAKAPAHAAKPKISLSQARSIAHKAAPGRIVKTASADGRYVFDIREKSGMQQVAVDATSGKVVENKSEGKNK